MLVKMVKLEMKKKNYIIPVIKKIKKKKILILMVHFLQIVF